MERVRIGIVGIGNVAPLNVRGYLEHDRCDVVALCEPRVDKGQRMASEWGVPKVYSELDQLLNDDEIDAVEILTPTYLHKEHVIAAIAAGKHVSCQKPIANTIADAREMVEAAERAGVMFRISECNLFYPPLVKAKELVASGAIGTPTMLRMKTVVGKTDTTFQNNLEYEGYIWRFDARSPGGHLFDDMVHKYATALWLFDEHIKSVQAVVRRGPLFFEAPTAALWEYGRDDLLGLMEVTYAPNMFMRSSFYGADEFFEIQGTDGFVWVTRATGEMLDMPPVIVRHADGTSTEFSNLDANWLNGFRDSSKHFVDALLEGRTTADMDGDLAIRTMQLCFAVYQASNERRPIDPSTIDGSISPPWWPPDLRRLAAEAGYDEGSREPAGATD